MSNVITGEHLQDLFIKERWQDHFTALSDTLGFTLSIYSESGKPIFVSPGIHLCGSFRSASSEFKSQCESYCDPLMMGALKTGKPKIYKCYAKIMNFALPVEYMDEKAVILGQGSFASYEDFRECMDRLSPLGIDTIPISTHLTFTGAKQAWNVCVFVADSVNRLLKNTQETVILRKKMESLKSVFGIWSGAEEQPEALYRHMTSKLFTLLDIESVAILTLDKARRTYTSLYSLKKTGEQAEALDISENDAIVRELLGGKSFVLSAEPVADRRADFLNGTGALYFFPIMANRKLEGILAVSDRALKENDINIITSFCRQTGLIMENQRLRRELNRKFDRFAAASELTKAMTPLLDYGILLQTILDTSAELLMAEQGSLMLLDHETEALLLEAKKGMPDSIAENLMIPKGKGIAGKVAELGEPFLVANVEDDPRTRQKNRQRYKTRSFVSVPLKAEDRIIGVLNLSDKTTGGVFDEDDLELIQSFATHAAVVMERNALYSQTEELKKQSITDHLTGLLNRRYLHERLEEELSRSSRYERRLSLLMVDLDGFKYYNDTYGHLLGDKILKIIAEAIVKSVRSVDLVSRYGGDEFMVILPETDVASAVTIAERLRNDIATTALPARPSSFVTASIGVVCYPEHGTSTEQLLVNVDKALYGAKNRGKNRIEVFS